MTPSANQIFRVFLLSLLICVAPALAQNAQKLPPPAPATDATWTRAYASNGKDIKWDARFSPMLKAAFPQHQWFSLDHYKLSSVVHIVPIYIGTDDTPILDENRYITVSGCMPHACMTRGMLWIDTEAHPAKLIFVATDWVRNTTTDKGPNNLFWIFSSSTLSWQQLPQPFLDSFHRWQNQLAKQDNKFHDAWLDQFLFANIVQPTGEITPITPSVLGLEPTTNGAKQ